MQYILRLKPSRYILLATLSLLIVKIALASPQVLTQLGQLNSDQPNKSSVHSQEFESIAPQPVPQQEVPKTSTDKALPEVKGDTTIIADELVGIVFVASPQAVEKAGIRDLLAYGNPEDKIVFGGNVNPPNSTAFRKIVRPYLTGAVSQLRLNELIRDIILHYRGNDRPIVDAYIPVQTMTDGVLQIVITEGRLGRISVEGNEHFPSELLQAQLQAQSGDVILESKMNEDVRWLNRNPFRQIELIYEKGEEPGTTDVVLDVNDRIPVRVYGGFSDSGNNLTGFERFVTGVNWGNAFGRDDQLNYQFTSSDDDDLLQAHSLVYIPTLPWRHTLTLIGSYADSGADFPNPILALDGTSWQLGMRYRIPLRVKETYEDSITFGYDFKRSDNSLLANQIRLSNTVTDVSEFSLAYDILVPLEKGAVSGGVVLFWSPGEMSGRNNSTTFRSVGAGDSDYVYLRANTNYVRQILNDFTLSLRGEIQFASDNLIGSEKYGLGGFSSVRGYDNREVNGDEGYLISAEIRTPPFSLGEKIKFEPIQNDQLQFILFADYGGVSLKNPTIGADPHQNLFGIGPGLRYSVSTNVSVRFDYGFQLIDSGAGTLTRNSRNQRAHLSAMISF